MEQQTRPTANQWARAFMTLVIASVLALFVVDRYLPIAAVMLLAFAFGWLWSAVLRAKLRQLGMR